MTILQSNAMDIYKIFYDNETFNASAGWLDHWKKQYGIHQLNITDKKLSSNSEQVAKFTKKFQKLLKGNNLCKDQQFNHNETELNFLLPTIENLSCKKDKHQLLYVRRAKF